MINTTTNIIEKYLISKRLEYKVLNSRSGPQFLIKRSPITGEEKWHHFYISAITGMWDDKKSQKKGNWNQFRALYGDDMMALPEQVFEPKQREFRALSYDLIMKYAQNLHSGLEKESMEYLTVTRGLEEKTLLHFKIGVDNGKITIPIIDGTNTLVNIRRRKSPNDKSDTPKYMPEAGCKSILFNEKCLNDTPNELFICEGEFDAMQLWQRGITSVVATTLGAGSFPDEWVQQLRDIKRIYIVYDNDNPETSSSKINAGLEGAKRVAGLLGEDRTSIIELPRGESESKMDVSEFFIEKGKSIEDFLDLVREVNKRKKIQTDNIIKHVSDYNELLRKRLVEGEYKGISTGYSKFDEVIGGLRKGRVIMWSGLPSVGKTSSAICLALSLAQRNIPNIFITTEMSPIDIYRKFLLLNQKIPGNKLDKVEEGTSLMTLIDNGLRKFKGDGNSDGLPLYIMDSVGQITLQKVLDVCKVAKKDYGMEVIFIDHLHYFATSMKNQEAEISNTMKQIKAIAMELDVPIVLLAHIGREGRAKQRRGLYIPTMQDLKGSSAIEQDADQIVFICRDSESPDEMEKRKSVWKISKNRDGATGHTSMDFDPDIGFFSEVGGVDYMKVVEDVEEKPRRNTPRLRESEVDDIFF